jgi:hypothetical protein
LAAPDSIAVAVPTGAAGAGAPPDGDPVAAAWPGALAAGAAGAEPGAPAPTGELEAADVTGDAAELSTEVTGAAAEVTADVAEVTVEAVDVCVVVSGGSAAVAAWAGRENTSMIAKIPAAASAACTATRAMRRATGCTMSSSTRRETRPLTYPWRRQQTSRAWTFCAVTTVQRQRQSGKGERSRLGLKPAVIGRPVTALIHRFSTAAACSFTVQSPRWGQ